MTKYAAYPARPRTAVRKDLARQGAWATFDDRKLPSRGRVSSDIDGMVPMSQARADARKAREARWADRALTNGSFAAETRSKLTQAYDAPTKAEKHYTDMQIRLRKPPASQTQILRRMDAGRKAREAARAEARKAWK